MPTDLTCKIPIGLVAALHEAGLSHGEVLAAARLPSHLLDIEGQRVPVAEYFALWQAIRTVSDNPNIGIVLATSVKADLTEPLFLAIMSAADVAGAIEVVSKYKRCLEPQDLLVHTDETTKELVLAYEWPAAEAALPQVLVDAELAFIVEVCRRATRRASLNPREVRLRTTLLEEGSQYANFFRCPIRLGEATNGLVFAAEDAATPFVTFNPQMLNALLPYLQANTPPSPGSTVARVRSAIAERVRGRRPTVHAVGRELAMSGRALQRALRDNGTSFRQLLDEVRNEHARGYLSSTSFSDGEVAFLLGFEEANSFYRAFRSWNGMSPSEFRRQPVVSRSA